MALTENLNSFIVDFGVPVVFGQISDYGILDMPSEIIAGGMVMTTDYALTIVAARFPGLGYQSSITVDGNAYTVREVRQIDDGKFAVAYLSKT